MLSFLAVRFFILCSSLLLKTFANTSVLISTGAIVFEAANCVRQDVLLEEVKRLAVGFRDVLNLCEFRGMAVQNRGLRTLQVLSYSAINIRSNSRRVSTPTSRPSIMQTFAMMRMARTRHEFGRRSKARRTGTKIVSSGHYLRPAPANTLRISRKD
jgi:hypothetical protein